jgi:D-glycero-D-manno-heptose 1,7-bisphosphate phosphatase
MRIVPLLLVDIDSTVRKGREELGRFVRTADDVEVYPEAAARVREFAAFGGHVAGVTNQGGVGLGLLSIEDLDANLAATQERCPGLSTIAACTHAPEEGCFCRKPAPGLAIVAASQLEGGTWETYGNAMARDYRRTKTAMIGDRPEDRDFAANVGIRFFWSNAWRANTEQYKSWVRVTFGVK